MSSMHAPDEALLDFDPVKNDIDASLYAKIVDEHKQRANSAELSSSETLLENRKTSNLLLFEDKEPSINDATDQFIQVEEMEDQLSDSYSSSDD